MAHQFDIDLHPERTSSVNTTVSKFELDSLWETHVKTSVQLEALKQEHNLLKSDFDQSQADLEEANKRLMLQSFQLDDEKAHKGRLTEQLLQQLLLNFLLQGELRSISVEMKDGETQTHQEFSPMQPRQAERAYADNKSDDSIEKKLREKLAKMEAMYDIIKRQNEGMRRQEAKMKSKLRILSEENEYLDQNLGTTISKQGRFEVRKWVECDRCCQGFASHEEMEKSVCNYHPMQAVPQDGTGGRKYYYLCCSELVKKKGQAQGCCQGKHILNMKNG